MNLITSTTEDLVRYGPSEVPDIETNYEDIPAPVQKLRRRSSFFAEARRRSFGNTLLNESCDLQSPISTGKDAYIKYMDLLEEEEKEWKKTIKIRKDEYQETKRMYSEFCQERHVLTEEEGWSLLDEEQKKYLSNLPDFSYIESRCHYNKELVILLQNQNLKNEITLNKILEIAEDKIEVCKAKIHQYTTRN